MMNEFDKMVSAGEREGLHCDSIEIFQVNLGLNCNLSCAHCHLEASPGRTEQMDWPTMARIMEAAEQAGCRFFDLTGGSPELNPNFRRFVTELRRAGHTVQVRTNLTAMFEPGMEDLPEFLAGEEVRLVASLPCYLEENVDRQRGSDTYRRSIEVIRALNDRGYGVDDGLQLNLVYNPAGPSLPLAQESLEADYRRELKERFGISFTSLLTVTNMPIGRFRTQLAADGKEAAYTGLLRDAFNPGTVGGLMCRHQVSVAWDGTLYDCDFNLALGMSMDHGAPDHIRRFDPQQVGCRRVVTGHHCFGCTAGFGSSCAGALT
jgi:radical SAM/Cys-rich protein